MPNDEEPPVVDPGYRPFLMLCRLTGCCFIEGLWTKRRLSDLKINVASWYLLVSFTALFLFLCPPVAFVAAFSYKAAEPSRTTGIVINGLYTLLYLQSVASVFSVLRHAGSIKRILKTCGTLETRIGLRKEKVGRTLARWSRLSLFFAIVDGLKFFAMTRKIMPGATIALKNTPEAVKLLCAACFFTGVALVGLWHNLCVWMIVYNAVTLREYFASVNESLVRALAAKTGCCEALEEVRRVQAALRDVVLKLNSVLGLQSTFYYAVSVYFMCALLFGTMESYAGVFDRAIRVVFALSLAFGLLITTRAAHGMTSEVRKRFSTRLWVNYFPTREGWFILVFFRTRWLGCEYCAVVVAVTCLITSPTACVTSFFVVTKFFRFFHVFLIIFRYNALVITCQM